jgi:Gram-negative bacterial TonB protein C-terminal
VSNRTMCMSLCAGTLLSAPPAFGDFQSAMHEYSAGHYEVAHAQFLALAELGDCSAQFNLGAMALKGQGGPADLGSGAGWLRAAADNGCQQLVGNKLASLESRLSPDQTRAAADIVARYGREALHAQGIVDPDFVCRDLSAPGALETPSPEYPRLKGERPQRALVISRLTIGVDGHARDPEILLSLPQSAFAAAAVEAWLNSRFTPAMREGAPVAARIEAKAVFSTEDATTLADMPALKQARTAANAGDPAASYLFGVVATLDGSLGVSSARATRLVLDAARDGEAAAQYWVGSQLRATAACHPRADGSVWLTHAAAAGSAGARLTLALDLIKGTPSEAQVRRAHELLAQAASAESYYVGKHVVALLASSPVAALRDPGAALGIAARLLAGEIQSDPEMFEAVAAAYAASGDFRNAVAQQQVALRKAQGLGWDTRATLQRLADYRSGRSWSGELLAAD